ncbi:MAG: hypothetical protein R2883_06000 [Caldisericia bacterium]
MNILKRELILNTEDPKPVKPIIDEDILIDEERRARRFIIRRIGRRQ